MIITNKYNTNKIDNVKSFPSNKTFIRLPELNTNQTLFLKVAIKNRWEGTTLLKPERKLQHD